MQQVRENLMSTDVSGVGTLSDREHAIVDQVREQYRALCPIPCTDCGYCMPCPNGVEIPRNFSRYNEGIMYNRADKARDDYQGASEETRASACIQCRECEEKCPQSILISEWMPVVHEVLGEGKPYVCELP
jgi:predicted aldo/keto reductase-like oxidoreductase